MKQLINLLFQVLFSSAILFVVYFLFLLGDFKGGLDGLISLVLSQLILGSLLVGGTLAICFIIGLPIRLNARLNRWWVDNSIYIVIGLATAAILLIICIVEYWRAPTIRDNSMGEYYKSAGMSFQIISIVSWFVTAFFALHVYPVMVIKKMHSWLTTTK